MSLPPQSRFRTSHHHEDPGCYPLQQPTFCFPLPQAPATIILLFTSDMSSQNCHVHEIIQIQPWGLALFTQHNSLVIHSGCCMWRELFPFLLRSSVPGHGCSTASLTSHPLKDTWVVSSFWLLQTKLLWTCLCVNINFHFSGRIH